MRREMRHPSSSSVGSWGLALSLIVLVTGGCMEQGSVVMTPQGDWTHITGNAMGQRYSTLDQIDPSNFESLELTWQYEPSDHGRVLARPTPVYVNGPVDGCSVVAIESCRLQGSARCRA